MKRRLSRVIDFQMIVASKFVKLENNPTEQQLATINEGNNGVELHETEICYQTVDCSFLDLSEASIFYDHGIEENWYQSVFWHTRSLNRANVMNFIEEPVQTFALHEFKPTEKLSNKSDMTVIVKFKEQEFTMSKNCLSQSNFFETLMNERWNGQSVQGDHLIIDMSPIQNEIFEDSTNVVLYFEEYFKYLKDHTLPKNYEMRRKLLELSKYLSDDLFMFHFVKQLNILERFYYLSKAEKVDFYHLAILNSYLVNQLSEKIEQVSDSVLDCLFESSLSGGAKARLYQHLNQSYKLQCEDFLFGKHSTIYQTSFTSFTDSCYQRRGILLGQTEAINLVMTSHDNEIMEISCPEKDLLLRKTLPFFYVQVVKGSQSCGFWVSNKDASPKKLFTIGVGENADFETIHLVLFKA